jgi:type VI secretion system protein ImpH
VSEPAAVAPPESGAAARPPDPALVERLKQAPWAWDFFAAMRRLEAAYRDHPRLGRSQRPAQDALRLAQEPSVIFAPSALAGWEAGEGGRPPRLLVHFFGLFGPDGPLPLHLTEYARDRRRNHRDPTLQRFADLFHHRALSLFWRAWAESRPTVSFDRPEEDQFARYVGSLIGLGMESFRNRDAMPDLTKLHFAGHLACQTRHAEGLGDILSEFFTMPVRVACFIGGWLSLPVADRTRLGGGAASAALGGAKGSILVGARVWSRQHKFRLVFGPLSMADYMRLLPGGLSFRRLIPIVRNYAGDTLEWDVNIILKREEVPKLELGKAGQLGWTSWIGTRRQETDAADLFLDASADSMARTLDAASGSQ